MDSDTARPAIGIVYFGASLSIWREVLLGIEEEGIPVEIQAATQGEVIHCAWLAACRSPLLVGIACDDSRLVVHYRRLAASAPLFTLSSRHSRLAQRRIGNNAARLVKGVPFREPHRETTGEAQYE